MLSADSERPVFIEGPNEEAEGFSERRSKEDLTDEFVAVRRATLTRFRTFDEEQLNTFGKANNHPISVAAIGFIIVGHVKHHCNILKERYLWESFVYQMQSSALSIGYAGLIHR